ncbi:kinase-like domain, phloem protein 2-like protein, partial [Tanacetum coccineum]
MVTSRFLSSLISQEKIEHLNISLDDIMLATQDFSLDNLIGKGGSGPVYKGQVTCAQGCEIIAVKRLDRMSNQRETQRVTELEVLLEYKHENIIALLGRCNEKRENIMVYEYASKGSFDRWLKYDGLTWRKRLEICIDIARGLAFLHGTSGAKQEVVIHGDIKSAHVLLNDDWKAKIAHFGCSLICPINQEMRYVVNNAKGTPGYCDPLNTTTGVLTKESDIYSFGVLLFEMLCGRSVVEHNSSRAHNLVHLVRDHFEEGTLYEIVFEATKRHLAPKSLTTFLNIARQCLHEERSKRPTANDVLIQLKKSLELQLKHPITPLYSVGSNSSPPSSFLTFNFDSMGKFTGLRSMLYGDGYRNRFGQVAWIADSSMMYLQFKIKAHLLSPGVNYGVNLLFKFSDPRKKSITSMDLEYHIGNKFLRSHCTTKRDDGWLMKELFQFSSLAEEADIDVFLLGLSGSHYVNQVVYIEGIEFRAINNASLHSHSIFVLSFINLMTHEEMEELKRVSTANVQQSPTDKGHWKVNMAE